MSTAEEDTELRDILAQTLESNGTLGKLRAQLRASIFLVLDSYDSTHSKIPKINSKLKEFLATEKGKETLFLITDFLKYYELEHTLAVLKPECGLNDTDVEDKSLLKSHQQNSDGRPILVDMLNKNESTQSVGTKSHDLTDNQVEDAKRKFRSYDADKNGAIDKDELRLLFQDLFPLFNRNMLERYVNDEFRSVDKNFSNSIDFEEFLGMYKRLFVQCRSVVATQLDGVLSNQRSSLYRSGSSPSGSPGQSPSHTASHSATRSASASSRRTEPSSRSSAGPAAGDSGSSSGGRRTGSGVGGGSGGIVDSLSRAPLSPQGSSLDEDPFIDDSNRSPSHKVNKDESGPAGGSGQQNGGGLTSLHDLPSLGPSPTDKKENFTSFGHRHNLFLDDEDYAPDFEEEPKSGGRSARSDKSAGGKSGISGGSIDEFIEGDLDEDPLSQSGMDELTTDRTVDSERSFGVDYMEDAVRLK